MSVKLSQSCLSHQLVSALLIYAAICSCFLSAVEGETDSRQGTTLQLKLPEKAPAMGPIRCVLTFINHTNETLSVARKDGRPLVTITGMDNWSSRLRDSGISFGKTNWDRVAPGETTSWDIYLHGLFEGIGPGTTELNVTLTAWRPYEEGELTRHNYLNYRVLTSTKATLVIQDDTSEALDARVAKIVAFLETLEGKDKFAAIRSLEGVTSEKLFPVWVNVLEGGRLMWELHPMAKRELAILCVKLKTTEPVLTYLLKTNRWNLQPLFVDLGREGVSFTPDQRRQLRQAKNPWVRLAVVEELPSDGEGERTLSLLRKQLLDEAKDAQKITDEDTRRTEIERIKQLLEEVDRVRVRIRQVPAHEK